MEASQIAKQLIGFQKTVFDSSYNTLSVVQDQAENMITNVMGKFPGVTEDGKKQMNQTFSFNKKAREDIKKSIEEGYAKLENLLDQK